ncbi:hypothetical protein AB0F88_16770 [Streptosporangium sp. NPDC023963]|uniref:hypothetical protein n=1 Tax=Streptosporangium sp. NPDC023963 TaxID=3155608 RepID=UPI0034229E60
MLNSSHAEPLLLLGVDDTPNLVGWQVTATSVLAGQVVKGVMLPATAAGLLRLHPDDGDAPLLELDPARWRITPRVSLQERRRQSRRLIHCPNGLLIYRYGDLPTTQLATKTMLRRLRRRPATGQPPIASYMMQKGYAPLFAVADSQELPPLPPARQAAWILARTCARCASRSDRPYEKTERDQQRYCPPCQQPAAEEWQQQNRGGGHG